MKKDILIKVGIVVGIFAMLAAIVFVIVPKLQEVEEVDTLVEEVVEVEVEEDNDALVVVEDEPVSDEEVSEGEVEEPVQEGVIE
jgi:type IV secretory pathway component VirB8